MVFPACGSSAIAVDVMSKLSAIFLSATLAGDSFPGPIISANKVTISILDDLYNSNSVSPFLKGRRVLDQRDGPTDRPKSRSWHIHRKITFYPLRKLDTFYLQHWHGIKQRRTNYVDGAAGVTQCPLTPNENFVYEFNALDQAVSLSCLNREILN